jgi:uncharacterized protein YdeI (YjbR/CyaY-like superfamily)
VFLERPEELRDWFARHHETAPELWLGSYKRSTGRPSISWSDAVDEALCVGWIDSIRYSLDDERSAQRFTPRRRGSHWSAINVRKVGELSAAGRMRPAGLAAFAARRPDRTEVDPAERGEAATLTDAETERIQADDAAWAHWEARPPGYRRQVVGWITSAKQPATRERRLAALIADSAAGRLVKPFRRPGS